MTNRAEKHQCPFCPANVRRIGKHLNQKHPLATAGHTCNAGCDRVKAAAA